MPFTDSSDPMDTQCKLPFWHFYGNKIFQRDYKYIYSRQTIDGKKKDQGKSLKFRIVLRNTLQQSSPFKIQQLNLCSNVNQRYLFNRLSEINITRSVMQSTWIMHCDFSYLHKCLLKRRISNQWKRSTFRIWKCYLDAVKTGAYSFPNN